MEDKDFLDSGSFEWFDEFLDYLKGLPQHDVHMLDVRRVRDMNDAYRSIVESLRFGNCDAKISCGYEKFGGSYGYIRVEGKSIEFASLGYFLRAAMLADNTEAYPLANGRVRMAFSFSRIMRPI